MCTAASCSESSSIFLKDTLWAHTAGILFPDLCLLNYLTRTLNVAQTHQGRGQCKGNRKCCFIFLRPHRLLPIGRAEVLSQGKNAQVERLKVGVIPHKQWLGGRWCTWHSGMEVVFGGGGTDLYQGLLLLTYEWGSIALCDATTCRLSQGFLCVCIRLLSSLGSSHTDLDTLVKWI